MLADTDPSVQVAIVGGAALVITGLIGMFGSGRQRSKRIEASLTATNGDGQPGMPIGEAVYKLVGEIAVIRDQAVKVVNDVDLVKMQGAEMAADIVDIHSGLARHERQLELHIQQDRYNQVAVRSDLKEQQRVVKDALAVRHGKVDAVLGTIDDAVNNRQPSDQTLSQNVQDIHADLPAAQDHREGG